MYLTKLKEMFNEMVIKKDASLIPLYYHPAFLLYTNEEVINYDTFLNDHIAFYQNPIRYQVEYDEETWVEQEEKIAGRLWITISSADETPKKN